MCPNAKPISEAPSRPRKKRILHIITNMDPSGAPLAVWNLVRRLSRERYAVSVASGPTEDPAQDLTPEVSASGIPVFRVPSLRRGVNPLLDAAALWHLIRTIGKDRYDLVHCHKSKAGFLGRFAARLCGVRAVVYTPHGNVLKGYFGPAATWFFARVEGMAAPFCDRIISLTRTEIEQYLAEGIGSPGQHTFIYNGIDVDAFTREASDPAGFRSEIGVGSEAFLIVNVGRLVPVKGQVHLIDSLPGILEGCPDAAVVIAGEGPLLHDLRRRARALGVGAHLHLVGHRSDVARILAAADLFALPSLNEGLGLALVEGMAMGLAAVASRVGGVPEVLKDGETGLLVPPADPRALGEAVVCLAKDPERRRAMGEAGKERARVCFSIDRTVRDTERLYEELLRG